MGAVLVTGGAGYIGSHTVKALRAAGRDVVVLDDLVGRATGRPSRACRSSRPASPTRGRSGARVAPPRRDRGDALRGVGVGGRVGSPTRTRTTPTTWSPRSPSSAPCGTSRCATWSSRPPPPCTARREETPIREEHPTLPVNPYGETKLAVERALPHYESAYGLAAIRLRYFNAAGADPDGTIGEDHRPENHVIPQGDRRGAGRAALRDLRHGLRNARRDVPARLRPRLGPGRCARPVAGGARGGAAGARLQRGHGPAALRARRPGGGRARDRASAGPRGPPGDAPEIRRSCTPRARASRTSWAGARASGIWMRSWRPPGAGCARTPPATPGRRSIPEKANRGPPPRAAGAPRQALPAAASARHPGHGRVRGGERRPRLPVPAGAERRVRRRRPARSGADQPARRGDPRLHRAEGDRRVLLRLPDGRHRAVGRPRPPQRAVRPRRGPVGQLLRAPQRRDR